MTQNSQIREYIYNGAAIVGTIEKQEKEQNLKVDFDKLIESKEVFTVKVTGVRDDAVTVNVLGDYMGVIPTAQVSHRMYVRHNMDELIGQNIPVIMLKCDKDTKICELSREYAVRQLRKDFMSEIIPIMQEINKEGEKPNYKNYSFKHEEGKDPFYDKYPRVKAKVVQFDSERKKVMLNIAGLDIFGTMDISKFDHKYIYNPEKFIESYMQPNTVIDVALLAFYDNSKQGKPSSFVCSRRHTLADPWVNVEKRISKDDVIIVKALAKRDNHFFASYVNFPLDIKCYYPDAPDRELKPGEIYGRRLVKIGKEYKVKIVVVNSKNKMLAAEYIGEM